MSTKTRIVVIIQFLVAGLLLAGCVGGGTTQSTPTSSPFTAGLSELQGDVQIKQPDQSDYTAAQNGMVLQVTGGVHTAEDGRVRLNLSTGSIIRLAPLTTFILESNVPANDSLLTHIKMEAGRIWVILSGGTLEVETPSGLASVRGSLLSVWIDPDTQDIWVSCLEGWCQAENPSGVLDLLAGQGAILYHFDPSSTIPPPPPLLRFLTPEEIEEFLANNPDAREQLENMIATASALPTFTSTSIGTPTPTSTATPTPTSTSTATPTPLAAYAVFTYEDGPTGTLTRCSNPYAADVLDPVGMTKVWVHFQVRNNATSEIVRSGDVPLSSASTRLNYWEASFAIRTHFPGTVPQLYISTVEWYFAAIDTSGVEAKSDWYTFIDTLKCSEGH